MLAALDDGVKGGVWFSLIDKVYAPANLGSAWSKVARNGGSPGVDGITVDRYAGEADANLRRLSAQLKAGTYRPKPIRRALIPKGDGTTRPLGIPTVQDRIVQGAVRHAIEPVFERRFANHSYGFRPGRGCKDALRRVDALLKAGHRYVVDADLKSYFDCEGRSPDRTIPHDKLMARVRERIADGRVLKLIEAFLTAHVMDGLERWTPASDGFEFLGYRFDKGRRRPRDKSHAKLRDAIRVQTRRTSGVSLQVTIARLNPVLRGWFGYFKHCPQWVMTQVDGYVRGRLRGILRRRHGLRGRGRGVDHQRWPNAYFAALGLFSLQQAHRRACQSMKMAH